jgi:GNAT superfamily N-acetyltransferase
MTGPVTANTNAAAVETVVTYLEMTEPPRMLPPQPVGPRVALMKVDTVPLHFYRYLYATIGHDWLWVERLELDDDALAKMVQRDGIEISVLYANGAPAGYFELDLAGGETVDLVYFGLMRDWTGRKIGPWLLGCAVMEAFSAEAERLTINTCTLDHPSALRLYQRIGFQPVRRETKSLTIPAGMPLPAHIRP